MKNLLRVVCVALFGSSVLWTQTILNANEPGNTYEDINSVFAPSYNVIEVPDCIHTNFGRHIDEVFDSELNEYVFRFRAHKTPDNDRCQSFDRQRTEIKTYDKSPDILKAIEGEIVQYKWRFKIPIDFKVSPNFTHLHQIKSVDGPYASIPMITLTARKSTPDRLELRYTPTNDQNTIETLDLDLLRGLWLDVTETIHFSNNGSYKLTINKVSDNSLLLSYYNDNIDMWQDGASFARPKWGIYRSLINNNFLQDEDVLFNNFSIEENPSLSTLEFQSRIETIRLVPNPAKQIVSLKNIQSKDYEKVEVFDSNGKKVLWQEKQINDVLNISTLSSGLYFIALLKDNQTVKILKCLKE